jgi:chromate transporter
MTTLKEIFLLFLKLGSISFGGPAAHIAMMEDEVVRKRRWMTHEHFLDLVGATNLIPGPNSTEMTMHCGYEQRGWKGLLVAGASFIAPAILITGLIAWLYQQYGTLPDAEKFIYGIKPAVIAIIANAAIPLGKRAFKNSTLIFLGIAVLIATLFGVNEIYALFSAGAVGMLFHIGNKAKERTLSVVPGLQILLIFFKTGALLYGSGYVLFAFLDAELVATGLLSREVLIDSVAAGQFTPGPVLSTATFIGWQMGGLSGSLLATLGIFLPSFLFVALLNPLLPRLKKSKLFSAFLDAVNAASVAVIVTVCIKMGMDALTDWKSTMIALVSMASLLYFKRLNSAFVVLGGALAGYLLLLV